MENGVESKMEEREYSTDEGRFLGCHITDLVFFFLHINCFHAVKACV